MDDVESNGVANARKVALTCTWGVMSILGGVFALIACFDAESVNQIRHYGFFMAVAFAGGTFAACFLFNLGTGDRWKPYARQCADWAAKHGSTLVWLLPVPALLLAFFWLFSPPTLDQADAALRISVALMGSVLLPSLAAAAFRPSIRRLRSYVIEYAIWAFIGIAVLAMAYWCVETYMSPIEYPEYLKLVPPFSSAIVIAGAGWLIATYSKRRDNAIEMTRRLASPEMHVSRRIVDDFLTQVAELEFLDDTAIATIVVMHRTNGLRLPRGEASLRGDLDQALEAEKARRRRERKKDIRSGLGWSAKSGDSISIETHLSSLMAFYELLYSLAREGAIEVSAVRNSFGQRIAWIFVFLYEAYHGEKGSYRFVLEKFEHLQLLAKPRQIEGFRQDWEKLREDALEEWRKELVEKA